MLIAFIVFIKIVCCFRQLLKIEQVQDKSAEKHLLAGSDPENETTGQLKKKLDKDQPSGMHPRARLR